MASSGASTVLHSPLVRRGVLVCLVLVGVMGALEARTFVAGPRLTANDFTPDYVSARALSDGDDPYGPVRSLISEHLGPETPYFAEPPLDQRNAHPPFLILLLSPLSALPFLGARVALIVIEAMLFVGATAWLLHAVGVGRQMSLAAAVGVLALPPVQADLLLGQVNGLLLALLLAGWARLRVSDEIGAGLLLGIATAMKLYPGLIIVALLRKRAFKAAAWQVGTAAVLSGAATLVVGWDATWYFAFDVSSDNLSFWLPSMESVSLTSVPFRWLTENRWFPSLADLDLVARTLGVVIFGASLLAALRAPARFSGDPLWGVVPWLLLAGPATWEHYLILALPTVILGMRRFGTLTRGGQVAALVASVFCLTAPASSLTVLTLLDLPQDSAAGWLAGWAIPLYGLVCLCALEVTARRRSVSMTT